MGKETRERERERETALDKRKAIRWEVNIVEEAIRLSDVFYFNLEA